MEISVYQKPFADGEAVQFSHREGDVTQALQEAINSLKREKGYGIIFLEEGVYLLSDTIYVPRAIRLIGWGKTRPRLVLKERSPGFQEDVPEDKGKSRYLLWFTDRVPDPGEAVADANAGTFYSALSNIDLEIGERNPCAVALRTHFAQHSFISHCRVCAGSGRAGLFDVGNELEDVAFEGGEYGIYTTRTSPSWPCLLMNARFSGQRRAAIHTREAGLTIVNLEVRDCPRAIEIEDGFCEKLYLEDGVFENISDCLVTAPLDRCAANQLSLRNLCGRRVNFIARLEESGRNVKPEQETFFLREFSHGLVMKGVSGQASLQTVCETEALSSFPLSFPKRIPDLPPQDEWVNVRELGAAGDGETDDTAVLQRAVDSHAVLYFPQGFYRLSDTLRLREHTALIGLNPISTRLMVKDNEPVFGGFGTPKPLLESGKGGGNLINGIAIDTAARNPRICGCKWTAGPDSYMNDVKFYGGHGSMNPGGENVPVYNESRTADSDPARKWDSQYWSLWITENGGGVFKDIWSASPYAAAGLFLSDTAAAGAMYAVSVEHHVRREVLMQNVSGWSFYALQTEEEVAESSWCQPLELSGCDSLTFADLYLFRVIWVDNAFPQAVLARDCRNTEFWNLRNFTQMKYTMDFTLRDADGGKAVRPWQLTRLTLNTERPAPKSGGRVERLADGFDNVDAICTDSRGNVYFCDSRKKNIYQLDCQTGLIRPVWDTPYRPLSLICDGEDRLLAVCEYFPPKGSGERYPKPADAEGTAYGAWYNTGSAIKVYAVDPQDPGRTMTVLECRDRAELTGVKTVVYPGNRWRDNNDHLSIVCRSWEKGWQAPDGATVIACCYDLVRACCLQKAVPGKPFLSADEFYKRTVRLQVNDACELFSPQVLEERGEYCSLELPSGTVCILDGGLFVYRQAGEPEYLEFPERPACMVPVGENTLVITARTALYRVRL